MIKKTNFEKKEAKPKNVLYFLKSDVIIFLIIHFWRTFF